jgi:multidrug efflux pump subunit AcrA (membrane-fusion protein)
MKKMKIKPAFTSLIVVLCVGLGVFALLKFDGTASLADEGTPAAPVVTVQTAVLKRMTLHRYLTGYGTVAPAPATPAAPAADAPLAAPTAGVVARVYVAEGQRVHKGQVLMTLNSASVTVAYAQQEVARQKELFAQHNTSLKNLQNAEAQLALLRVTAPLSGTVIRVGVKPGAAVDMNTVVAEVMDLKRLVVKTEIPVSDAGELASGQAVQVQTNPPVIAAVTFISPSVSERNGTIRVLARLPADCRLRPGQFVPLRIVTAVHRNCLAAPAESVVTDISGKSVLSLVQGDEAIQTPIQTGFREKGWVEVKAAALKPGDTVVTVGAYGLPKRTRIQLVHG